MTLKSPKQHYDDTDGVRHRPFLLIKISTAQPADIRGLG